ncbi:hypothetical protein EVAR_9507_1 [Eumeta japonica]|uniref:Uncharacterized protein n=1 Tax=Eumeta variegata TaxID=151549 RepID=A0A4C1U3U9_EUMVA|nr:hypothetical protein EVAR_9507_1 [Eumeta japonica]
MSGKFGYLERILETARRMDITVWISSPNDERPAATDAGGGTGGARQTASPCGFWAALGGCGSCLFPQGLVEDAEAGRKLAPVGTEFLAA